MQQKEDTHELKFIMLELGKELQEVRIENQQLNNGSSTTAKDRGIQLIEILREIKELRTRMDDIHILFRPTKEKKTRKQIHDDEIDAMVAEYKANMLLMKDHD